MQIWQRTCRKLYKYVTSYGITYSLLGQVVRTEQNCTYRAKLTGLLLNDDIILYSVLYRKELATVELKLMVARQRRPLHHFVLQDHQTLTENSRCLFVVYDSYLVFDLYLFMYLLKNLNIEINICGQLTQK